LKHKDSELPEEDFVNLDSFVYFCAS